MRIAKKNAEITEYYKKVFADIDDYSNGNRINIFKKDWLLARHKNVFSKYIGVDKKIIFITKLNYDKYYLLLIFGDDCIEPSEIIPFKYGKGESAINIYSVNNRKLFFIPNSVSIVNKDIFASIIDKAKNFLENNYS